MIDFVPDRALYPFVSRWFDAPEGRMHYIDEGEGPVIVFCHGSPTWSFLYRHLVVALRDRFRCIAVDNLGFGLSERPEGFGYAVGELAAALGEIIDHLALDDVIVMGHDWGGPIGLTAAVERAGRIRGLVLGNTAFWPIDALPNRAFSAVMSTRPLQRRILERNLLIERVLLAELGGAITEEEAEHYRAVQPDPAARAALAVMPREIRAARPLLARLEREIPTVLGEVPTLAVWGMRDRVFPPGRCLPRVTAAFENVQVIELPNAGHAVQESAPGEIAAAIAGTFG